MHSWRPVPVCVLLAACSSIRGNPPEAPASERAVGAFSAKLALTGRSTYTGANRVTGCSRELHRGSLHLTSPVTVDAVVSGMVRRDSLILIGSYTAGNGCAGDLKASLSMPTDRAADGPIQLTDK